MKKTVFVILILAVISGCGIKGDPLPPAVEETVQKNSTEPAAVAPVPASAKDTKTKAKKK